MGEVRRVYVEKKKDYAVKAKDLHAALKQYRGLDVESVRVLDPGLVVFGAFFIGAGTRNEQRRNQRER